MAYHDQYAGNQEYNPYANPQPHASYETPQAASDETFHDRDTAYHPTGPSKTRDGDEVSGFERGEFGSPRGEKMTFGQYRREMRDENPWTKGGRGHCIGRFICCTLMIAIFMIVSIVLALALWIRPPSIVIGTAGLTSAGTSGVAFTTSGISVPLEVNISVSNPNYFSVELKKLTLDLTYPLNGNNTDVGNGTLSDITFHSHSNTNFTFPFNIDYEYASDPSYAILINMAQKCGLLGESQEDLTVDYKITVDIKILVVSISPTISNSFSLSCPFNSDELESIIKQFGLSSLGL